MFLVVLVVVLRGALGLYGVLPGAMQDRGVVYSGLAITGVVLIVSVAPIFLASMADRPKIRAASIVAGFVGLAMVMAFGAELSWALSIELRY